MSTIPQMSQQGQQQYPSTSPYQQQGIGQQQPFGQQMPVAQQMPIGQQMQQPFGRHEIGQQVPQHLQQQLQQLGQQQPFQQLLQQLGGQQQIQQPGGQQQHQQIQQGEPLILQSAVETRALAIGMAQHFQDVVTALPGQPQALYLFIDNAWRRLVNPNQVTHDVVQKAFAYGQQVYGIYDTGTGAVQSVIVTK
ncbi:hypothetical protein [Streptomyces rhizosphaerihabitans]|uniref:hypothetical protein n=1 Tax=Streptomyces rhizosphaerihabitans TaxID=1266770 RepID=UPI0021BFDC82|nr:hypothetical protein [Streptomyces rhizosphaerihabitans]MCT9004534.1 hypothetical protein [Streptomyces rhizosphaerihabitans]